MYANLVTLRLRSSAQLARGLDVIEQGGVRSDAARKRASFVAFYAARTGDCDLMTISVYQTRAEAEEVSREKAPRLRTAMAGLLDGAPVIESGEVAVAVTRSSAV